MQEFEFIAHADGAVGAVARTVGKRVSAKARLLRWVSAAVGMTVAAATWALLAPSSDAAGGPSAVDVAAGRSLYQQSCITCHGANLSGVAGRGVPLIGTGSAAVYFQVSTGRMPLTRQGAEAERKPPQFTEEQTQQLAAFVQAVGGGPQAPTGNLRVTNGQDIAQGGELFRLNCASCHNFAGKGAPLSAGKEAPALDEATDEQIYTAMLSGPENMPVFSDNQLTPDQKKAVITYLQTLKAQRDPGGASLGRLGPVPEGLVIWTVGLGVLMLAILWIGNTSGRSGPQ